MKSPVSVILVLLGLGIGCRGGEGKEWVGKVEGDEPMVFVWKMPGHTRPGDPARPGLVVAVWEDGRVVRARTTDDVGKVYVKGRLTGQQMAETRRLITESGLLRTGSESTPVVDAETEYVGMRDGYRMPWRAHSPGFANSEDPRLTRMKERLMELKLGNAEEEPVDGWGTYPKNWLE